MPWLDVGDNYSINMNSSSWLQSYWNANFSGGTLYYGGIQTNSYYGLRHSNGSVFYLWGYIHQNPGQAIPYGDSYVTGYEMYDAQGRLVIELGEMPAIYLSTFMNWWLSSGSMATALSHVDSLLDGLPIRIYGGNSNDVLVGYTGNDTIYGQSGDDTLNGGVGTDTLVGGAGNDTYVIDSAGDVISEALNAGNDTAQSSVSYTIGANVEHLILTSTGSINGTGNALNNTIQGTGGNNVLNGGAGNDTMAGSYGNDTYVVDAAGDVIMETGGDVSDTVQSYITYTLTSLALENLTLIGSSSINGTGNSMNNRLTGNAGNNILNGGVGNDIMVGAPGNDTYVVNVATDIVVESTAGAAGGTDTVQSPVTWTLGTNVEKLVLTGTSSVNGTGNTLNNILTGNSGHNLLDGGLGNDTMIGGLGHDIYRVNVGTDIVTEALNAGTDTVQSAVSYALSVNVENLLLTGTAAINGTGNILNNVITGNSGKNVLYGLDGHDTLNGGLGIDTLVGGNGSDTYVVDVTTDIVFEATAAGGPAAGGIDTVQSAVSWTLGANVENLLLTGTGSTSGTGNTLANVVTGNSSNNLLSGGLGADTLNGGDGHDTLVWDAADVSVNAGNGTDTLRVDGTTALNLTVIANTKIQNVEVINLAGTNVLTLNVQDVLEISSTTDALRVDGAAGDTVDLLAGGGGWTEGVDPVVIGANSYRSFTQGMATLLVDNDITVTT